jgi:3-deoxy-D-manno-octulosonic-acid transferase
LLLVLVPRHPERFSAVFRLCTRYGCKTVLRTRESASISADTEVYLGDTMGDLALLIAASDFAYIGGSLVPVGGHNVLEACAAGVAVLFGPYMHNFQEISDQVLAKGAGVQVIDSEELGAVVARLVNDPMMRDQYGSQGKLFIEENRGALAKITGLIKLYT